MAESKKDTCLISLVFYTRVPLARSKNVQFCQLFLFTLLFLKRYLHCCLCNQPFKYYLLTYYYSGLEFSLKTFLSPPSLLYMANSTRVRRETDSFCLSIYFSLTLEQFIWVKVSRMEIIFLQNFGCIVFQFSILLPRSLKTFYW